MLHTHVEKSRPCSLRVYNINRQEIMGSEWKDYHPKRKANFFCMDEALQHFAT